MRRTSTAELRRGRPSREQFARLARRPVSLVLAGLKPANLGSIFRTADAALLEHVYVCGGRFHPGSLRFRKAARGIDRWVPHTQVGDLVGLLRQLRERGVFIVALEQTAQAVEYARADARFPMALVVGSEREGVGEEALALCDAAVEIPMDGMGNSLNVAVATGIVVLHVVDQLRRTRPQ